VSYLTEEIQDLEEMAEKADDLLFALKEARKYLKGLEEDTRNKWLDNDNCWTDLWMEHHHFDDENLDIVISSQNFDHLMYLLNPENYD